jgi:pimeloyl-ACP methyl ester carboxylesterase
VTAPTDPSAIADTAMGPVDHVDAGEGDPVVFLHGAPGGSDSGALMARFLLDAGFRTVAPSRPGYLGTPLTDRTATPEGQARLVLALMDALGIDRFAVACWSGGGPAAYRLAAVAPERVTALVAIAAITDGALFDADLSGHILQRRVGRWIVTEMQRRQDRPLVAEALAHGDSFDRSRMPELVAEVWDDEATRRFVLDLVAMIDSRRLVGLGNDMAQFGALGSLDLAAIAAPVLLVHGTLDTDVVPAHADRAEAVLVGAERLDLEGASHVGLWTGPGAGEAQARIVSFLADSFLTRPEAARHRAR